MIYYNRVIEIDDNYRLLLWVTKVINSNSTDYEIYVKEVNKDGEENLSSVFSNYLVSISYANDESPINPTPNIIFFEISNSEGLEFVWTQKVNNITYGTYSKFFYKLDNYSNWNIINDYSGNQSIFLVKIMIIF